MYTKMAATDELLLTLYLNLNVNLTFA